jgi:hypothetical protein
MSFRRSSGQHERHAIALDPDLHDVATPAAEDSDERVQLLHRCVRSTKHRQRAAWLLQASTGSSSLGRASAACRDRTIRTKLRNAAALNSLMYLAGAADLQHCRNETFRCKLDISLHREEAI